MNGRRNPVKKMPRVARATKPVGAAANKARQLNIFISYASEDKELIGSIVGLLNETFIFAPLVIFRDVEIKEGKNYARAIDEALDKADILLVVFTERMKATHSYTGYEIGFFNRSIKQRPVGGAGVERIFIPFCIGADIPDTMHYIQGVSVDADEVYKVTKTRIDTGAEPSVGEGHPVFKLLARISELVMQVVSSEGKNLVARQQTSTLAVPASKLYKIIHDYLQSRISSETYPERKLIIRTPKRPDIGKQGVDLTNASVELVGDFSDIFSVSLTQSVGREYAWSEFCDRIPTELRSTAVAGVQQLTAGVLKGGGDNYHVVTTPQRDKSFRLFVSKVVTYVSQKTELDIYVVQMRTKEYGDPLTSRLLKSISAGLRFRFLVLEDQSDFRPDKLGHPVVTAPDLKARISEMLGQMDLIMRDASEANLSDPALLILIWGPGQEKKMQDMMEVWERTAKQLYAAANAVLDSADDVEFKRTKTDFIGALKSFCADVEEMNREFTSRVLSLLASHIQGKSSKGVSDTR